MENNNGKGIFYGVIGVATLVVAIIGATFAFFAASASTADDAVNTTSATVENLKLTENAAGIRTGIIPMDSKNAKFAGVIGAVAKTSQNGEKNTGKCYDDNGNAICSVYSFTVENPNDTAQTIYVSLTPTAIDFTNLHYAVFEGNGLAASYNVNGETAAYAAGSNGLLAKGAFTKDDKTAIALDNATTTLAGKTSATYTVVVWLEETNTPQNDTDAGKTFAGRIDVTTTNGTTGVTGVLAA